MALLEQKISQLTHCFLGDAAVILSVISEHIFMDHIYEHFLWIPKFIFNDTLSTTARQQTITKPMLAQSFFVKWVTRPQRVNGLLYMAPDSLC